MLAPKSIAVRLAVFVTAILVFVGAAVCYAVFEPHQEMLRQREVERFKILSEEESSRIAEVINRLREDVQFLAGTPPIQGIARARASGGR